MRKWGQLILERFSPAAYLPMILLFTAANSLYLSHDLEITWNGGRLAWVFLCLLSFFFRMRLFDEIKDYEIDLRINPTRPLARGLLSIREVKVALFILILLELLISAQFGLVAFLIHAMAIAYSLLMYEEFFLGDYLRPHLTSYAVTHTFVSVLLGFSGAAMMTEVSSMQLSWDQALFFFANWAFFNLFEFARKTYAPEEERDTVPSYSKLFKPLGAAALSLSQAAIGIFLISRVVKFPWLWIAFFAYAAIVIVYLFKTSPATARLFRGVSGAFLIVIYALTIVGLGF